MTDRASSLTVVLENNMRVDDVECLVNAILMLKNVLSVDKNISNYETYVAQIRAERRIMEKIYDLFDKENIGEM
jgi:hypothetical protein